jgi:hypothetical protein
MLRDYRVDRQCLSFFEQANKEKFLKSNLTMALLCEFIRTIAMTMMMSLIIAEISKKNM